MTRMFGPIKGSTSLAIAEMLCKMPTPCLTGVYCEAKRLSRPARGQSEERALAAAGALDPAAAVHVKVEAIGAELHRLDSARHGPTDDIGASCLTRSLGEFVGIPLPHGKPSLFLLVPGRWRSRLRGLSGCGAGSSRDERQRGEEKLVVYLNSPGLVDRGGSAAPVLSGYAPSGEDDHNTLRRVSPVKRNDA